MLFYASLPSDVVDYGLTNEISLHRSTVLPLVSCKDGNKRWEEENALSLHLDCGSKVPETLTSFLRKKSRIAAWNSDQLPHIYEPGLDDVVKQVPRKEPFLQHQH
ncbi:hypothetical protein OPV22_019991 [Ensete ventricosum]|uniref:Uncharacterized protein n=1 Tax=Ensete ventricosum TaxID=4639 RepID=A0AAV8QIA8_ENSVE|nr:hypothetical protein OPV22_019991 [Ensete ventricosum]